MSDPASGPGDARPDDTAPDDTAPGDTAPDPESLDDETESVLENERELRDDSAEDAEPATSTS